MAKAQYSTWIRKKRIAIFSTVLLGILSLALLFRGNWAVSLALLALALPFAYIVFVLSYTYYQFSAFGGNYQARIHSAMVDRIAARDGKLLDIGTGSGALGIRAVKELPQVTATGIDSWGDNWEYSKQLCEQNAQIEGVASRTKFMQGSAARLPFADDEFDVVVSCLTFHEVRDESDKARVLQEALRVLKRGGEFVFLDLFLDQQTFGNLEDLVTRLAVSSIDSAKLDQVMHLPGLLLQKRSLGNALLLHGVK